MIQSLALGSRITAAAAPLAQEAAPSVTTDFADYIPDAFVNLYGSNWQPGESVHVTVNDDAGQTWSHNSDPDPLADENGIFTYQFQLPNYFVANYSVTATGTISGIATTSFAGSNPSANLDQCASDPAPSSSTDGCDSSAMPLMDEVTTNTPTGTATNTPLPPTATPTNTATNTPLLPTATSTPTDTPVPPTATPTNTPTDTPVPPTATPTNTPTPTPQPHIGTIGFWKNWRNHYNSTQFQALINYLKTDNPKIYNKDLTTGTSDDLTIAKVDAIFNLGKSTPRDQMILAQFTALKFNLAITQLDGSGGLVQKNDDICLVGVVNVASISGATAFFGTSTPTVQQVVDAVENRWRGDLTTSRNNWKFSFSNNAQRDMIIKILTGINEGKIVVSSGCP